MGRAERRKKERNDRLERRKNSILMSREELNQVKNRISSFSTEYLMTCFALAEHRIHGFDGDKIAETLTYVDELMGEILTGEKCMNDHILALAEETGIEVRCEN